MLNKLLFISFFHFSSAEIWPIRNSSISPILFHNKYIMLIDKSCTDILMINLGPSYIQKIGTGKSSHSLIND
jgi:hypothetical protein